MKYILKCFDWSTYAIVDFRVFDKIEEAKSALRSEVLLFCGNRLSANDHISSKGTYAAFQEDIGKISVDLTWEIVDYSNNYECIWLDFWRTKYNTLKTSTET